MSTEATSTQLLLMKRITIRLPERKLRALDAVIANRWTRSQAIELALDDLLARSASNEVESWDLAIYERCADELNGEVEDALGYQVWS